MCVVTFPEFQMLEDSTESCMENRNSDLFLLLLKTLLLDEIERETQRHTLA